MQIDLLQTRPVAVGKSEALESIDLALVESLGRGSALLITPEMYLTGYNIGAEAVKTHAETLDGPSIRALRDLAARHKTAILTGFPEKGNNNQIYNAAVLIDKSGEIIVSMRKTHLYGRADHAMFTAGDSLCQIIEFCGWKLGVAICYDIEFPELVRAHVRRGAQAILCPTANMLPYTGIPTRIVPARAEENEIYVAYANYIGQEGEFEYCGLSCVVGPDGEDRARASLDKAEVITAEFNHDEYNTIRETSTHYTDLRPELYG